jgi:hypothetical protein
MRLVIRQLLSSIRSRRRISSLLVVSLFISIAFILFIIDDNHQSKSFVNEIIKQQHQQIKLSNKNTIIITKTITAQK